MEEKKSGIKNRGFASMSLEKRRAIATLGGKSVKPENRSYSQNRLLASEAGRIGGKARAKAFE